MKLILQKTFICQRDHWMLPQEPVTKRFHHVVEVESVEAIKFRHSEIERGWFSDTVREYDAVRYGDEVYRLQYDIEREAWIGLWSWESPSQGTYDVNYEEIIEEKMNLNPNFRPA